MGQVAYTNNWPAKHHATPALAATAAAAVAAGRLYKAVVFMATGSLDVVDFDGSVETITLPAGSVYPVQNWGAVTGGGTTLIANQFACLYD